MARNTAEPEHGAAVPREAPPPSPRDELGPRVAPPLGGQVGRPSASRVASGHPDPRVEERVGQVHQQVHHHDEDHADQDRALHHRVVAVQDRRAR